MVVVRRAVLAMYGDVNLVAALHEVEMIDGEHHVGVARQFAWPRSLDVGVRAVAAGPLRIEEGDAEHEIALGSGGMYSEVNFHGGAGREEVCRLSTATQFHVGDLDLARSPSSFASLRQVGRRIGSPCADGGLRMANACRSERLVLGSGDVEKIRIDDA